MTCTTHWRRVLPPFMAALLGMSLRAAVPSEEALLKIALDSRASVVERTRAFADLRAVATDGSVSAFAALLNHPVWSYSARSVLEVMPGPSAERALLHALESSRDATLQTGLINSLGNRRSGEVVPVVAKFLASPESAPAEAALNALGNIGTARAADTLAAFSPPTSLRATWGDAMLRVAEALQSSDRRKSLELYRSVATSGASPQIAAATMGLARESEDPNAVVVAALTSAEVTSRLAALALIRAGEFGPELSERLARTFSSLRSDVQVQVLSVLQDRADRSAAPIARAALTVTDSAVRAAAAKLLSVVGDASDASALLRMMTGQAEPAPSARLALARIPGEHMTALLLERFRGGGEDRGAALEVLVKRGHRSLLAELLHPEVYVDAAFGQLAANAILTLGTGADLGKVLALHAKLPPGQRVLLEGALRRLAAKHPSSDEAAALVVEAAKKLPLVEAGSLVVMLAGIGGDRAFASLSEMVGSPSAETRKVALRALGSWQDDRPASLLLAAARNDADPAVRAVAVQSATAVFRKSALGDDGAPTPERVAAAIGRLRTTWDLAERPDAKNAVIAALRGLKDAKAVAVADELENTERRRK